MSSETAIRISGLSKSYQIARERDVRATNLGEAIVERIRNPLKRSQTETFWALKEIDLEIKKGEVVGVIGRNGAGKSTLLKILSRITEPTTGRIELFGRVGSLLEVGTGFHPELTGRENIYLNGAILGMRKSEITRQFDAIVDFAGIEKFLDTPVKRYSSGMYVRLAFAVAAHLNPEILIVDEVLAVGDAEFQKKCMGKMKDVAGDGRTVLFVSHNLGAVSDLCSRSIYLQRGAVIADDSSEIVVRKYFQDASTNLLGKLHPDLVNLVTKNRRFCFLRAELNDANGTARRDFSIRESLQLEIAFKAEEELSNIDLSVRIMRFDGVAVFTSLQSESSPESLNTSRIGCHAYRLSIPGMFLLPGDYYINIAAHPPLGEILDSIESAVRFTIHDAGSAFAQYGGYTNIGVIFSRVTWHSLDDQNDLLSQPSTTLQTSVHEPIL